MSTKLNVDTFIAVLRKSGLIDRDRLEEVLKDFPEGTGGTDASLALVDRLIAANLLTRWQSEKLLQGKHRGYFLGKYKLLSLLGKGGMSSVYLAEHLLMRRRCALKVLPAKRVDDSSYLERFHREAQAVALLDHPNIVRAYDVDHQTDGERQIHFLVMEHVDGPSLQEMVTERGVLPFLDAAEYARQAAAGLQDAHEHGMVHRDIKPGNLLVDQGGVVKVLDLGLARFFTVEEGSEALTIRHDEKVLGTADYLAPEQALDSHTVDARADIYSLGCTLFFMLTGQPPFTEGTLAQRLMAHQVKPPPAVESLRRDIPPGLAAILRKMMEKQAQDRYPTAADVEKALFQWIDENADATWRSAHSIQYGSRVSEPLRKAIPIAQPVVAKIVEPALTNSTSPVSKPVSAKTGIPKTQSPDADATAIDQFFSKLSQSNIDTKRPGSTTDPSIKVNSKTTTDIEQVSVTTNTDLPVETSPYPVFSPQPLEKATTPKTAEVARSSASIKAVTGSKTSSTKNRPAAKSTADVWHKLSPTLRNGIAFAAVLGILLMIYLVWGGGSGPGPGGKKELFHKDKREVTVGGPKAEYASIKEALIDIRNRYRPASEVDRMVVRIAAGTYNEKLRIDGRSKQWPEGIVLQGDGEVIIRATGEDPVIRLVKVSRFVIDNIQIDANGHPTAIEVADDLPESRLRNLVVRAFSNVGILCRGTRGLAFGNNQFVLEQLTFEPAGNQAVGIRTEDEVNDVESVTIRGCRFLSPMSAGIQIECRAPYNIDVTECVFNQVTDGIRIDGQPTLKGIRFVNNSFRQTKYGICFSKMPSDQSTDVTFRRNLFSSPEVAEAAVLEGYDESRFRTMISMNPPGIENNWTDRTKSAAPARGEIQFLFENGRQPEPNLAFVSTDPKSPKFLAPTGSSPQKEVPGAQPFEKPWVGAIAP